MERSAAVVQARYWQVRQLGLFAGMASSDVRQLVEHAESGLVEAGKHVYERGELADHVHVLQSGQVKITRGSEDGRGFVLFLVSPGEIFGESAISGEERRDSSATVLDDAFVHAIERRQFERAMLRHPELALQVARLIGRRKERAERRILEMISKDVRTRVAHTLAELAGEHGAVARRGVRLDLALTQTDLAQLVGSTRETTSTVFNEFRRAGLVEAEGRTIWVLDPQRLERYALPPGIGGKGKAA